MGQAGLSGRGLQRRNYIKARAEGRDQALHPLQPGCAACQNTNLYLLRRLHHGRESAQAKHNAQ
jgi:hypothetical protein